MDDVCSNLVHQAIIGGRGSRWHLGFLGGPDNHLVRCAVDGYTCTGATGLELAWLRNSRLRAELARGVGHNLATWTTHEMAQRQEVSSCVPNTGIYVIGPSLSVSDIRWPRALQLVHPAANTSLELRLLECHWVVLLPYLGSGLVGRIAIQWWPLTRLCSSVSRAVWVPYSVWGSFGMLGL